jgi:RNA polymerase sigma-70 factor (ECF subfamily)
VTLATVEQVDARQAREATAASLVARFQAGETDAFGDLYRLYFDDVHSYLRVMLKDATDAEDIAQQVFIKALRSLPRYEQRGTAVAAWLFAIARNAAYDALRRRRSHPADPSVIALLSDRAYRRAAESGGLDVDLLALVDALPARQREVVLLRFGLDLTPVEIGQVLGRTTDSVWGITYRALARLEQALVALNHPAAKPRQGRRRRYVRSAQLAA